MTEKVSVLGRSTLIALGIDPGSASGALALLIGDHATVFDVPTAVTVKRGKTKTRVDEPEAFALIGRLAAIGVDVAAVELVGGSAGQSAPAAFNFGYATGVLVSACRAHGLQPTRPASVTWKLALGLKDDEDGSRARELAARLYPNAAPDLRRKGDHNRADAILIAHYARLTHATNG